MKHASKFDYSITFPCYNAIEYTKKCINSMIQNGEDLGRVIAVDNGSTDGTQEYLKSLPLGKVILNKQNLGVGVALNQGVLEFQTEWTIVMDNDLVDFAMQCPVKLKLNNLSEVVRVNENEPGSKQNKFFQKTKDGKQILRDVMKKYIPSEIVNAKKQGFSSPDASWFKGESIDFVKRKLMNDDAIIFNWLDKEIVNKLIEEHLTGKNNRRLLIWSLLNVEEWMDKTLQ